MAAGLGSGWIGEQVSRPDLIGSAAAVLGWTPLGLAWAAPADVAAGALGTGLVRLALAVLVLALLLGLWDVLLRRALENPRSVSRAHPWPGRRRRVVRPAAGHPDRAPSPRAR